jgi:hypothetical protein
MNSKLVLHILAGAAFTSTAFAADWRDYSVGKAGTLQYDADSYRRDPGSPRATIETRGILSQPGHLDDGRAYARIEALTAIDCDRRESGAVEQRYVDANQQVLRKVASPDPQSPVFVKPDAGNLVRFVISVCQLELRGLGDASTQRRWIHYLENESGALYFDSASINALGPYEKAHVRLYYLGGAQMPNGEKVDLSEADWLIDCRSKRGAVTAEDKIRVEGGQGKVIASLKLKADANNMQFSLPTPGTLPALSNESLCSGELTRSR